MMKKPAKISLGIVIIVGTAANGAVLGTAIRAAMRKMNICLIF